MKQRLNFNIQAQPTDTTCGPACLHAIYNYFGYTIELDQVIREVVSLKAGGTLAVYLACHALKRGFNALIYTYNLNVFDPTWFADNSVNIRGKLEKQIQAKDIPKLHEATKGYLEFLSLGGTIRLQDLTPSLVRKYLKRGIPILTGLSSTYLYRCSREYGYDGDWDDIKGNPAGHFVVLYGCVCVEVKRLLGTQCSSLPSKHNYPERGKGQQNRIVSLITDNRDRINFTEIALPASSVLLSIAV